MEDWRNLKRKLKALGGIARLTIVYHLAHDHEVTVNDLTTRLNISQPLVSWHLRKLRRAGLVETRRAGRQVYCSLNLGQVQFCIQSLEKLIDPAILSELLPAGPALIEADMASEE
jgi:ArsR family transcriptional regulator